MICSSLNRLPFIVRLLSVDGLYLNSAEFSGGRPEGTYQHTITAFWEYLLLLEICHKIIEEDRVLHTRDNRLYNPYRALADAYASDEYVEEGDFSERMAHLIRNITDGYQTKYGFGKAEMLSAAELTELLYMHDVAKLRGALEDYVRFKRSSLDSVRQPG